jgi:hypothetical protein
MFPEGTKVWVLVHGQREYLGTVLKDPYKDVPMIDFDGHVSVNERTPVRLPPSPGLPNGSVVWCLDSEMELEAAKGMTC